MPTLDLDPRLVWHRGEARGCDADGDCDGPGADGSDAHAGLALRLVAVLGDLQRARGGVGADATAHRIHIQRERRALCAALGLLPDTGA